MIKHIAYIAPEIPGASSTFVYNEIFALEKAGCSIYPFTIHSGLENAETELLKQLSARSTKIYGQSFLQLMKENIALLMHRPGAYLAAWWLCFTCLIKTALRPKVCFGLLYRYLASAKASNKLLETEVEHIHCHFMHFPADIAMFVSCQTGLPFSVTAHANDIFSNFWLLKDKGKRAKFIATISNFNIQYLSGKEVPKHKLRLVRCGVDTKSFQCREQAPINKPLRLGCLARLVEKKGIDTLIQAVAQLSEEQRQRIVVEIAGTGPLQKDLKGLCNQLGIASQSICFLGAMDHSTVFSWLTGLNAFILPCKKDSENDMDGIPVALMEAMLLGVPVISTHISGIPELIENDVSGLLIDPEDTVGLARCLSAILDGEIKLESYVAAAREQVIGSFDLRDNADKLLQCFQGK